MARLKTGDLVRRKMRPRIDHPSDWPPDQRYVLTPGIIIKSKPETPSGMPKTHHVVWVVDGTTQLRIMSSQLLERVE